jgi:transcriptional regulator with XRE-family HTH domain
MIKNERQYRITKAEAERFQHTLSELDAKSAETNGVHPLLRKAERDALASQLEDLENQLRDYEELQSGRQAVLEVNSLAELPRALVQARIAANMSQKELAERLGMKEQQVQRYEATDYSGASLARLQEVCEAIGLNIREDVFMPSVTRTPERLFKRFKEIGFDKEFVLRRLVPTMIADRAKTDADRGAGQVIFHATNTASRIFGWTPAAILGTNPLPVDPRVLATARFKIPANADETKLSAYTVYAHYLALLLLEATADLPVKPIPTAADEVRAAIMSTYGEITFANALRYVWSLGVPVLPLKDTGAFHGACWRVNGRNVVVLKQRTSAIARWLHDNLHEFRHAGEEPDQPERTIIEAPETSPERRESDEEVEATMFASDVVLDGRAEELARLCVQATKRGGRGTGRLELLSSVVPAIADREGVPADALANYIAFRLSLQGENWWGPAMNLQRTDEDPWRIARDILLEYVKLSRLSGPDRDLLARALTEE